MCFSLREHAQKNKRQSRATRNKVTASSCNIISCFFFPLSTLPPSSEERANNRCVRVSVCVTLWWRLASSLSWHLGLFLDIWLLEATETWGEGGHTHSHTHRNKNTDMHTHAYTKCSVPSVISVSLVATEPPQSSPVLITQGRHAHKDTQSSCRGPHIGFYYLLQNDPPSYSVIGRLMVPFHFIVITPHYFFSSLSVCVFFFFLNLCNSLLGLASVCVSRFGRDILVFGSKELLLSDIKRDPFSFGRENNLIPFPLFSW